MVLRDVAFQHKRRKQVAVRANSRAWGGVIGTVYAATLLQAGHEVVLERQVVRRRISGDFATAVEAGLPDRGPARPGPR